jgi:phytoene/squalene synthetase
MEQSRAITRKSASNLALAFILLPREKRDAMSALYAFCREVDDVADEDTTPVADRRAQLSHWRADIRRACVGERPELPLNRELQPIIARFRLPFARFDELIQGCEMDLDQTRYENWAQLENYCYRVASVVGLLSIEIFGYRQPACRDLRGGRARRPSLGALRTTGARGSPAGAGALRTRPAVAACRGPARYGGSRVDGRGVLASARKAGAPAI